MDLTAAILRATDVQTDAIERALPTSFISSLKHSSKSLSIPWLGHLIGLIPPIEYAMKHACVQIESSKWVEPTIIWPLMYMNSATCKSNISRLAENLVADVVGRDFEPDEITFEALGQEMADNNNSAFWFFDEFRSFMAQLGMAGSPANIQRNEATVLKLYDGRRWNHSTVKSTNFNLPFTKLVLGGMSQTSHILSLLNNKEHMQSGLMPRFILFLLKPVFVDLDDLDEGDPSLHDKLVDILNVILENHADCNETRTKYMLYRKSSAYASFKNMYTIINEWLIHNCHAPHLQHAASIISKAKGQALRLAAILNTFLWLYDGDAVMEHEVGVLPQEINNFIPISKMAMDASIALVMFSVKQTLILKGVDEILIDLDNQSITTSQVDIEAASSSTSTSSSSSSLSSASSAASPSSSVSPSLQPSNSHNKMCGMSKVGMVLTSSIDQKISIYNCVRNKKIGRDPGESTRVNVLQIVHQIEDAGFGQMVDNDTFEYHDDILDKIVVNAEMKQFLTLHGVSRPKFTEAIKFTEANKKRKLSLSISKKTNDHQQSDTN